MITFFARQLPIFPSSYSDSWFMHLQNVNFEEGRKDSSIKVVICAINVLALTQILFFKLNTSFVIYFVEVPRKT